VQEILNQYEEIEESGQLMEYRDQQISLHDQKFFDAGEFIANITHNRDQALLKTVRMKTL
jgi:hypothetical protein